MNCDDISTTLFCGAKARPPDVSNNSPGEAGLRVSSRNLVWGGKGVAISRLCYSLHCQEYFWDGKGIAWS